MGLQDRDYMKSDYDGNKKKPSNKYSKLPAYNSLSKSSITSQLPKKQINFQIRISKKVLFVVFFMLGIVCGVNYFNNIRDKNKEEETKKVKLVLIEKQKQDDLEKTQKETLTLNKHLTQENEELKKKNEIISNSIISIVKNQQFLSKTNNSTNNHIVAPYIYTEENDIALREYWANRSIEAKKRTEEAIKDFELHHEFGPPPNMFPRR